MHSLKKVKIPDKVKELEGETFYGCKKLQEVKLSKKLVKLEPYTCFDDCPKLNKVTLSKANKHLKIENNTLLTKDGKNLIWVIPKKKNISVPDTVEIIETGAFYSSQAKKIHLGKRVIELQTDCLSGTKIETIDVDKENPVYAKDGQCIYRKDDGALVIGVAKQAKLVISNKVQKLTREATLCGTLSEDRELYLLDIPSSVTWLGKEWVFALPVSALGKVYYRSVTPPQLEKSGNDGDAQLQIFCEIYVPKQSLAAYQNWYRAAGDFDFIDKEDWHTFLG